MDEEAIPGSRNQCVSIRCMSSAALGSAAICEVEFGGGHLDYMWPLNYFEQQHCLLSQEVCTLGTTPKKVSIDPRFTPASSEVQQRKHEAEQDNWFCKPENTELRKEETYKCHAAWHTGRHIWVTTLPSQVVTRNSNQVHDHFHVQRPHNLLRSHR